MHNYASYVLIGLQNVSVNIKGKKAPPYISYAIKTAPNCGLIS